MDVTRCRQEDGAELFVMPHQMKMTVEQLLEELQAPSKDRVVYYQMQNSNLTDSEEWSVLLNDVDELKWASEAFGTAPDAVNFWMGDHRAVTSSKTPICNLAIDSSLCHEPVMIRSYQLLFSSQRPL